ncbi:hypothetical protein MBANPS3_010661 [Mucor bainieri]
MSKSCSTPRECFRRKCTNYDNCVDKAENFFAQRSKTDGNLLDEFAIAMLQKTADVTLGKPTNSFMKKRKAVARGTPNSSKKPKVDAPNKKKRDAQIKYIRRSVLSILGQLGIPNANVESKSFDSANNMPSRKFVMTGWPQDTTANGETILVKGLNEPIAAWGKPSLDAVHFHLASGFIKGRRTMEDGNLVEALFDVGENFLPTADYNGWNPVPAGGPVPVAVPQSDEAGTEFALRLLEPYHSATNSEAENFQ